MVNKAALGVIGVIVLATVGLGLLVGTVMDDGGDDTDGGPEPPGDDETQTPGTATATDEATTDEVNTPIPDDSHTPILPRRFQNTLIAENVTGFVNDARSEEDVGSLGTDGQTAQALRSMANGHSVDMADEGVVGHNVTGTGVADRYRSADVYQTCKITDDANVYTPDRADTFEVLGTGTVGQYVETDDGRTFVGNESQAARLIVDEWLDDEDARETLLNEHITRVGVGVEITGESDVFVTVNVCS